MTGAGAQDGVSTLVAGADAELAQLRELRDFVVSCRDGKISLDAFVKGPAWAQATDDDDLDNDDVDDFDLEELLDGLVQAVAAQAAASGSHTRQRKARRRSKG